MTNKDVLLLMAHVAAHAVVSEAKGDDDKQAVNVFLDDPESFDKARMFRIALSMNYKAMLRDYNDQELFPDPPGGAVPVGNDLVNKLMEQFGPMLMKYIPQLIGLAPK